MLVLLSWSRKATAESFPRKQPPLGAWGQDGRCCALNTHGCLRVWAIVPGLHHAGFATPALVWTALPDDGCWYWCGVGMRETNMEKWEFPQHSPEDEKENAVHSSLWLQLPKPCLQVFQLPLSKQVLGFTSGHKKGWLDSKEGHLTF